MKVNETTNERASNGDIIYNCTCTNCGKENVKASRSALICYRKGSCGCIKKSYGEIFISQLLTDNDIHYEEQVRMPNLSNLRFDFKVFLNKDDCNNFVLLEYDGE